MSYDPLQPDAYAEHLGDVNQAKHVLIAEDIRNAKGILIAKKGQYVSPEAVQRIVQFKLIKPLEESIEIADTLNGEKILADLRAITDSDADRRLHERYDMDEEFDRGTKFLSRFPILRQKLTVLAVQMPQEYRKSLLCAWYGILIARKLNMTPFERDQLFVAALTHDVGMLHIDRKITVKTEPLTADEWRTLQGHVAVGYAIVKQTQGIPYPAARAVLEHHEVADGTGYLAGKRGDELSALGRILGVTDAMCAVLFKLHAAGRGARDFIPILLINSYIYDREVCASFIQLLTEQELSDRSTIDDARIGEFAETLLRDRDLLHGYAGTIELLLNALPVDTATRISVQAARLVHEHLSGIVHSSGVLDEGYAAWLRGVAGERKREHYRQIEDTRLMLDEVRWQLLKLTRLLWAVEQDKNAMSAEQHHAFLAQLNGLPPLRVA